MYATVRLFLNKFQGDTKTVFSDACSYWFAVILFRRFIRDGAELMYDEGANHFGARIKERIYDVTGDVTGKYRWVPWNEYGDMPRRQEIVKTIMF